MEDDLRIAILGAGPIGLEAALYARYLGYPTQLIESADKCAARVLALGDQTVGKFANVVSRLGISALRAQDPDRLPPAANASITAADWCAQYLAPLAGSDLLSEILRLNHEIVGVSRRDADNDAAFEICIRKSSNGNEVHEADIVIDATGVNSSIWYGDQEVDVELGFGNPEADFYVIGAKGGAASFEAGLVQIRELFAIIGEREDLDVYATMPAIE